MIHYRETTDTDLAVILDIERRAFGSDKEAELTANLLADPTAEPRLSLLAEDDGIAVGHVLFTAAAVVGAAGRVPAQLLAPLAVVPERHGQGIGDALTREGLARLRAAGHRLVFVLGHPSYYPRFGFRPAGALGYDAPYPIAEENAPAWMVLDLTPTAPDLGPGAGRGKVAMAASLDRPEYWRE